MGNTESTGCDSRKVVKVSDELTPLMKTRDSLTSQDNIKRINDATGFTTIRLREFEAGFCLIR